MNFANQVATITGAASGIGLLTAHRLCADGARVVLCDVNPEAVEAAADAIRGESGDANGVKVDVRPYAEVQAAVAQTLADYGRIDLLVTCAGGASTRIFGRSEPFHQLPIEVIDGGGAMRT